MGAPTAALEAAVEALPDAGGIVLFAAGTYLKQRKLWRIRKDHVLLWAPGGRATLHGTVREQTQAERDDPSFCGPREQAAIFERGKGARVPCGETVPPYGTGSLAPGR